MRFNVTGGGHLRQFAIFAGVVLAIALAAAIWFGPSLIDWDRYREAIGDRIAARTGVAVAVNGPVRVALVPRPRARLSDVTVAGNGKGASLHLATVEANLDPVALLTGRVVPREVRVIAPRLTIDPERGTSGDLFPLMGAVPDGQIEVEDGTIRVGDRIEISELAATVAAAGAAGSRRISATALADGVPVTADVRLGGVRETERPFELDLGLPAASATLSYEGRVQVSGKPGVRGRVVASSPDLGVLTSLVARATGADAADIPLVPSALSIAGELAIDADGASLNDVEARIGNSQATGALSTTWAEKPRFDLVLVFGRVALDRLPTGEAAGLLRLLGRSDVVGSVDLEIEAIDIANRVLRSARLSAGRQERDAPWRVFRLGAELPGGGTLALAGMASLPPTGIPQFEGTLTTRADNLRLLLNWLDLYPTAIAPDRLRRLEMTADVALRAGAVEARRVAATLDGSQVAGQLAWRWSDMPRFTASLAADRLNLDAYLPNTAEAISDGGVRFPLTGVEGGLDLKVAHAVWRSRAIDDLKLAVAVGDGVATVQQFADSGGIH